MKKVVFFFLIMAIIIPGSAGALETIKFSVAGASVANIPAHIAIDEGIFERNGIKGELIIFRGGSQARNAFVGGSATFLISTYDHVFITNGKGFPTRVIMEFTHGFGMHLCVRKDSPYKTIRDLTGKAIGVTRYGSSTDNFMRYYLRENGIKPGEEIKLLPVGMGLTAWAAVEKDHVQAAMIHEPFLTKLREQGKLRVFSGFEERAKTAGYGLSTSLNMITEKPETVRTVVKCLMEGLQRIKSDPTVLKRMNEAHFKGIEPDIFEKMMKEYLSTFTYDGKPGKAYLKANNEVLKIGGSVKKDFGYDELVDLSFLK